MFSVLTVLLCISSPAWAAESDEEEPPVKTESSAEYVRLSHEMEKLATRNAWSGVERAFRRMEEHGAEPRFDDLVRGAHAAQALGDITSTRARLMKANAMVEDKEILNWLWDIDEHYGEVYLAGDLGKVELACSQMPFNPVQAKAVEFAVQQVQDTGIYAGYLPQGSYTFATRSIEVQPRVQSVRMDLRTEEGMKERRKAEKKMKREKKKDSKANRR